MAGTYSATLVLVFINFFPQILHFEVQFTVTGRNILKIDFPYISILLKKFELYEVNKFDSSLQL